MVPQASILIVDPEPKWASLGRQILEDAGYSVVIANKGERAVQLAAKEKISLILLEANTPGVGDGYDVAGRIRDFSDVPIIMLTAKCESEDVLRGFEAGADDYIVKPFDPKILVARINAVLSRCNSREISAPEIICNNLVINQASHRVTIDGLEVYLTETEFNLLLELARHRNQVLLHEHLIEKVWGSDFRTEIDNLRSFIHILRRKLEGNPSEPRLIISRPGIGYMLVSNQTEVSKE